VEDCLPRGRDSARGIEARRLAWEVLIAVEGGAFADAELGGRAARVLLDARDWALATRLVYGTLAWQGYLDHVLRACGQRPERLDAEVRTVLRLALLQLTKLSRIPEFAAVDTAVELAKSFRGGAASGLVNAVLRRFLRAGKRVPMPDAERDPNSFLSVAFSHPAWLVDRWVAELGRAEAESLLGADNEVAPTVLRVNGDRTDRGSLLRGLEEAGIAARPTEFSPDGVALESGFDPRRLPGFGEGLFVSQGEASQLAPWLLGSLEGRRVLEVCAAPGGKTAHLAGRVGAGGALVAVDRSPAGMRHVGETLARLGLVRVALIAADARALPLADRESFDAVLLDAPCSGLGTLRQHPEIKWRRHPGDLRDLAHLQGELLAAAAQRVRRGGVIVYATCTLTEIENDDVVDRFLRSERRFALDDPRPLLPEPARVLVDGRGFFRSFPHRHGLDGFFAARLKRPG
jgi:16S rRNA (cytosine967-C5)-methyltransferase